MIDNQTKERFIALRAIGWSFARISSELNISKPTLINLSRKLQFEIQNARAVEMEELAQQYLSTREERIKLLGRQLKTVEEELAKRDIATLPTTRLFSLAASLRKQIQSEGGEVVFTTPTNEIPEIERVAEVHDWKP
jgi:hypothetical protein